MSAPATRAELALADFQYFVESYLGIKLYPCQKVWADKFQAAVDGDYVGLQLLAPADHGKTSTIVAPAILWLLCRDRNNRIGICCGIDEYAEQIAQVVINYIEMLPDLATDFGLAKGDKWAVSGFKIVRPNRFDKNMSVKAFGIGTDIQSQRFDYIFCDDAITRKNSSVESKRATLRSFLATDLNSRLDHLPGKGKEFYFGHRGDNSDYYSENEDREGWLYHTDRAIVDDAEQKILCPEKWTYAKLAEKRAKDPLGFELLYQQQTAATGRFITRTSMERVRVPTLRFLTSMDGNHRALFKSTWLALDPAFTTTRWSSYAVMQMWGLTHDGFIRLIWGWREKVTPETLLPMMEMKFRLYRPDHFFIEDNAAQTMLVSHMRRKFPDQVGKFRGVTTINKDGRLEQEMISLFEFFNHEKPVIQIPYAGPTEQAFAHAMTEEFVAYPNGKTRDILMSMYIGLKGFGKLTQEERKGHVLNRGVLGAVADGARKRFQLLRRG